MPDRGDDGAGPVGGAGRAQRATGSPCATPRSRPHRDGSPPCFLSDISGWSLSLVGGVPPRRLLPAVADSVLANAGSGRRWRRRDRRRASRKTRRLLTNRPCLGFVYEETHSKRTSTRQQLDCAKTL